MQLSPECQALSFRPGRAIAAEVMRRTAGEPPQPRYHHFHPAAELVWFRRADAVLHSAGTACRTGGGDLIYLPSMMPHDFHVAPGETEFVLVLHDPAQERHLPPAVRARLAQGPLIVTADGPRAARIDGLAEWLVEALASDDSPDTAGATAARLLELLLTLVAGHGRPLAADTGTAAPLRDPLARLERAVALIHADPSRALSLAEAAQACNLSPAYFARLFRARMGLTFADYQQQHRLNVAAGLVAGSDLGIAEIAWRTGFGSPAHLSARFARRFGLPPSRYRAAARGSQTPFRAAGGGEGQDGTSLSPRRDKPAPSRA